MVDGGWCRREGRGAVGRSVGHLGVMSSEWSASFFEMMIRGLQPLR